MPTGILETELGLLQIETQNNFIHSIQFLDEEDVPKEEDADNPLMLEAKQQLKAYFEAKHQEFDLPLHFGGTDFQNKVWQKLVDIPFGKTSSYGELASHLGDPNYVRAVGNANGKNPIAIVVPCHRVIGSTGNLVGYAGGLWRKKWLLDFEGDLISGQTALF